MTLMQLKYVITVAGESSLNVAAKKLLYHSQVCLQLLKPLKRKLE